MKLPERIFGLRSTAIFETIAFLSVVVFLDYFFGKGTRFTNLAPHPFWIIVLLVTVQYGTVEGLFAALVSTLFLYVGNLPPQQAEESLFDYQLHLSILPVSWFIAAFILGEIRSRVDQDNINLQQQAKNTEKEVASITQAYDALKKIKESLEVQLASQLKSSAQSFKTFKSLGTLNPALILLSLDKVVLPTLNPKKFSVYSLGKNGFEPATSHGWSETDKFTLRFSQDHPLYDKIVGQQRVCCIINPEDENALLGEGILAAPLIDPDIGQVFGMLKIEEIDFNELNISNLESFKTICELIGIAYANARLHKKIEENGIYSQPSNFTIFSHQYYVIQSEYLKKCAEKYNLLFSQLVITMQKSLELKENDSLLRSAFFEMLKDLIPPTAQIFVGKGKGVQLIVLLPFMDKNGVDELISMILSAVEKHTLLNRIKLEFKIEMLNREELQKA